MAGLGESGWGWLPRLLLGLLAPACAPFVAAVGEPPAVTPAAWREARAALASLRARLAPSRRGTYVMKLALSVREPTLGRVFDARGAVAIRDRRTLRMLLVGPGGATAMDLWLSDDRYRLAVPALDLVRRGDRLTPPAARRALPVEFLRWWLLDPTRGALLAADAGALWLRPEPDEEAVVSLELRPDGAVRGRRFARRGPGGERTEEAVESDGRPCGAARYVDSSTGLEAEARCESVDEDAIPDPAAFVDPDSI